MLPLRSLQKSFGKYVLDAQPATIAQYFKSSIIPAEDILSIHRNNFRITLTEALASIFPAVKNLIGEDCFAAHARGFVERHPPKSAVLSVYGAAFPGFLEKQPALSEISYLGDVGRLEWAWNEAFHAADAPTLTPVELRRVATGCPDDLSLTPHPSVRLVSSPHRVSRIWHLARNHDANTENFDPGDGPEHLLILRPKSDVAIIDIDIGTYVFLSALRDGKDLDFAAIAALETTPEFSLEGSLGSLLVRGTFASFTTHLKDQKNDEHC